MCRLWILAEDFLVVNCVCVISSGYRFFIDVLAVSVVLLVGLFGKCGKSGVDSLVMDFHRM